MQLGAREAALSDVKMQYSSCPFMPQVELETTGRYPPTVVSGGLEMAETWAPCLRLGARRQARPRCSKSSWDFIALLGDSSNSSNRELLALWVFV